MEPEDPLAVSRTLRRGRLAAKAETAAGQRASSTMEGVVDDWSSSKLCDVANLFLGMILFFSPWLFSLPAGAQWQTASIIGIFIAVLSVAALAAFAVWEEWLNLIAGLWLMVSPWLLGFQDSKAMALDLAIGTIVVVLAASELWLTHDTGPGITASR
jgi:uncharacterized RDD family membrane protein YckC